MTTPTVEYFPGILYPTFTLARVVKRATSYLYHPLPEQPTTNRPTLSQAASAAASYSDSPSRHSSSPSPTSSLSSDNASVQASPKRKRPRIHYNHSMPISSSPAPLLPRHDNSRAMMTDPQKKDELVRLLLQSIQDLGFQNAVDVLQRESGICLEPSTVSDFRQAVRGGDWLKAEELLPSLVRVDSLNQARFLLRQQRYLELLESHMVMKALHLLQNELTPLGQNASHLHSLIFCSSAEDVKQQAGWDGAEGKSRELLLNALQQYVDSSTMIPNARLRTLLGQAFEYQRRRCLYHRSFGADFTLFHDHICDKKRFPFKPKHILRGHTDEVWYIAFSNSGRYLASVSRDKNCIIWDLQTYEKVRTLEGTRSSSYCSWSPDDSKLLVCDGELSFHLWNVQIGQQLRTFSDHKDQVTSCAWLPDGEHFISGTCERILQVWCVDGTLKEQQLSRRFYDVKISKDGRRVVTISNTYHIGVYKLNEHHLEWVADIQEEGRITCISLSNDGRYALVTIQQTSELHLWNLDEQRCEKRYSGHKNDNYIIRSSFGGEEDELILCGSEDNRVFVWNREHEELLEVLEGHENTVNCVAWRPTEPTQFASASDDYTICIWGLQEEATLGSEVHTAK